MLTIEDVKEIKMGDDGTFTIFKELNTKAQVLYCVCFDAIIVEKDDVLYYVRRKHNTNCYVVTPFPFKTLTKELLIEMEEEAVTLAYQKNYSFSNAKIEKLLNEEDEKSFDLDNDPLEFVKESVKHLDF